MLEGDDGLHGFWQSGVNYRRVIHSFELIGATTLVDPLNASRWCEKRLPRSLRGILRTIEEELFEGMNAA